jgi:hypothetical protein
MPSQKRLWYWSTDINGATLYDGCATKRAGQGEHGTSRRRKDVVRIRSGAADTARYGGLIGCPVGSIKPRHHQEIAAEQTQGFFVPEMVSSRWTERSQDAFHSALVMCVPLSQNSMHAAKPSRPPPGVSGNATPELPPVGRAVGTVESEVEVTIESGAIGNIWACGAAI